MAKDGDQVQSVLRALQILDIMSREQKIGISELGRRSGLKKTTVARLIDTLKQAGFIEQHLEDKTYSLTIRLFEIGSRFLVTLDIRRQARSLIEQFVNENGKSVLVSILDGSEVVYIDKIEAPELFRIIISVGGRSPAYCTASGKAMLAFMEPQRLRELLSGKTLRRNTEKTLTDVDSLEKDFSGVRARGYALDRMESHPTLCAVAAPVFDSSNQVIAAVSVPRVAATISDSDLDALGEEVAVLARGISRRFGWSPRKFPETGTRPT